MHNKKCCLFFSVGCPVGSKKFPSAESTVFFCYSGPVLGTSGDKKKFSGAIAKCGESSAILACPNAHMKDAAFSTLLLGFGGKFI